MPRRLWLVLLLFPLLLWPSLAIPFERDEGEYAYAAQLLLAGDVPYRDTFLQKPPGIVLAYAAVLAVHRVTPVAVRLGLLLVYLATGALLLRLAYPIVGGAGAGVAVAVYALGTTTPSLQATAFNTEPLMALWLVAAVWALVRRPEFRLGDVALAGLSFGLACFTKQVAIFHALHLVPLALWRTPSGQRFRTFAAFSLPAAAPYLLALAYFALRGALPEFLDGVLLHNLEYLTPGGEALSLRDAGRSPGPGLVEALGFLLALVALIVALVRRRWWPLALVGGWLVAAVLGAQSGSVYRGHYGLQALAPVSLGLGLLWHRARPLAVPAVAGLVALWLSAGGWLWSQSPAEMLAHRYRTAYFLLPPLAADWLRAEQAGHPVQSLYVFGSEPEIYAATGLRAPTRYVIQNPLFGGYPSSRARQGEVWQALQAAPPSHVITIHPRQQTPYFARYADPWLTERVDSLLAADFDTATILVLPLPSGRPVATRTPPADSLWRGLVLYRRRDSAARHAARGD